MLDCDCNKKCGCKTPCDGDPCGCGGGCRPASFACDFSLKPDVLNERYWWVTLNGLAKRIRVPKLAETSTYLDIDCTTKTLSYHGEKEDQKFTGAQLGCLLKLEDLADINIEHPEPCSMLVFNPGCGGCPCDPEEDTWQAYKIPDAGDCVTVPDEDGYYRILVKNDCGCIQECRLPVVAPEAAVINYVRDSVPDDPDFPWYYGIYNDRINLHLADNAPKYFGIYDLEVTVYYGIQVVHPTASINMNFRSLLVPAIPDTTINVEKMSSILQDDSTVSHGTLSIPWGSKSMRGSFSFIVPKGKEAYLHHEFRLISQASISGGTVQYQRSPYDGQKVPDNVASQVDAMVWTASRLNALQVVVKPVNGISNMDPVADAEREQLDDPVDEYPGLVS